jgi:protein tyrosine phosphatase (PTP) superfamily phosphohydrolase (DUF442 family)
MKFLKLALLSLSLIVAQTGLTHENTVPVGSVEQIKNFHFVSDKLASSGLLHLNDYDHINQYGFKHVINLIPGEQSEERARVESLGLSYQQIEVIWDEPTLEDFETFVKYMKSYGDDKIYVHCQLNWRASTFLYLYRVTQLGVSKQQAIKDLHKIWKPSETWQDYINKVEFAYSK